MQWLPGQLVVLALLALAGMGCKSRSRAGFDPVALQPSVVEDSLLVALQRGACFGTCPQFVFTVYKSGRAVYEGERHTRRLGLWTAQVSASRLTEIRALIAAHKMEQRDTAYINRYLADYPAFFITVCDRYPRKRIYVNHDQPPAEITEFVTRLEQWMEALDWQSRGGLKSDE